MENFLIHLPFVIPCSHYMILKKILYRIYMRSYLWREQIVLKRIYQFKYILQWNCENILLPFKNNLPYVKQNLILKITFLKLKNINEINTYIHYKEINCVGRINKKIF